MSFFIMLPLLIISCGNAEKQSEDGYVPSDEESISEETATIDGKVYDQLDPQGILILADKLEKGEPYIQKFRHTMTGETLERQVVGIENGKIVYTEEIPGGFELECRYSAESAKVIAQYYRDSAEAGGEPVGKTYTIDGKKVENPLQECTNAGTCILISPYEAQDEE